MFYKSYARQRWVLGKIWGKDQYFIFQFSSKAGQLWILESDLSVPLKEVSAFQRNKEEDWWERWPIHLLGQCPFFKRRPFRKHWMCLDKFTGGPLYNNSYSTSASFSKWRRRYHRVPTVYHFHRFSCPATYSSCPSNPTSKSRGGTFISRNCSRHCSRAVRFVKFLSADIWHSCR